MIHYSCDPEVALQTPKPRKIQRHEKVTQKWLSGSRWKWLKSYSKVTQRLLFSTVFVTFESLLSHFHRDPESHFWVTFLCLWIFRGLGVRGATSGSQHYRGPPTTHHPHKRPSSSGGIFWGVVCELSEPKKKQNTHHPQFRTRDVDRRFCGGGAWISRSDIRRPILGSSMWTSFCGK